MKWRLVIVILFGSVIVAIAQDISNGLNNKGGGQLLKNNLANPSSVIAGGGGGGGGGGCAGVLDLSKGCPLPMLGVF